MQPLSQPRAQAGVSLIEALVALVILSFGMIAMVGMQATMRLNADISKQRGEAVRIAQAEVERLRGFTRLASTGGASSSAYADISTLAEPQVVADFATNTQFKLTRTVVGDAGATLKSVLVNVEWADRKGLTQRVSLGTAVAGIEPALSGALSKAPNGAPNLQPAGRNPAIPVVAKDLGDGTSAFKPGAAGGSVVWVFNNLGGYITRVCSVSNAAIPNSGLNTENIVSCSDTQAHFLAGVVRFAYGVPMTAALSEAPDGNALNLDVNIILSSTPPSDPGYTCFDDAPATSAAAASAKIVRYQCAILANAKGTWSGRSNLVPAAFAGQPNAWELASSGAGKYKVCRYSTLAADTGANLQHPLDYVNVALREPLPHQNFLVISAQANCPSDVAADPSKGDYVNSNTRLHQPLSP